jgi:hypothetical protein
MASPTTMDSWDDRAVVEELLRFDKTFHPPGQECGDGRCKDLFAEFIYFVVVPAAAVLLILNIVFISMCVCCCVNR